MPDLRLANHCPCHIRSMGTTNVCYKELPHSNQPSLSPNIFSTCATYIAHARFCFLATFRELSLKLYLCLLLHILYKTLEKLLAFSPTCTANWCYTHISMLHRESSYLALPTVTIVCHNNSILAYSPLERLLPRPPDRNFNTHNNQYNDLNLVIFTSVPNLTN